MAHAPPEMATAPGATPIARHREAAGRGDPAGACTGTKAAIQRGGPPAPARVTAARGPYLRRRGGRPVCWVKMAPGAGWVCAGSFFFCSDPVAAEGVEFLRRGAW